VWQWRELYGGAILSQMKRLGASVDWQREYFTMDDNLSRGVREAFVRLYEKGLIYRGKYIVNWCPRCVTAISDLEVVHEEVQGKLYEIKYPIVGEPGRTITVATTRPETMLGDTGIAVNPKDARYQALIGKKALVPLMNREIPIVADDWANPEFGTGAVKITPAHDPNDFEVGKRHNLVQLNIMDEYARINENGGPYQGLDRYVAREKVLADLEAQGLLGAVKDHTLSVGKCDRCKTVVEPRLSVQWFFKVKGAVADRAIEAVKRDFIKITPENYKTIYLNWMENIYDWCISRQLWWGHRIPAWHCSDCKQDTVSRETPGPKTCAHCGSTHIEQDTDVLDTWFSSGLLPFTVFGWPEKTKDLEVFYPTTLLVTGFDILFFWVARMIMLGCWFMGQEDALDKLPVGDARDAKLKRSVPFENVYIHALVRDADRQKMSKTKGNVIDPIEITEKYGTDAVRFTLASMASPGTDIAFSESRTESYRAFANKIWNAARFIFMHRDKAIASGAWKSGTSPAAASMSNVTALEDQWIWGRLHAVSAQVHDALADYRFHEAANEVYQFFWGEYCDWYIEIVKLRLNAGETDVQKAATAEGLTSALKVFEASLRLLSPFMPFITEEIWHAVYEGKAPLKSIALSAFPQREEFIPASLPAAAATDVEKGFASAVSRMAVLQALITDVRNLRAEMKIEPKQKAPVEIFAAPDVRTLIEQNRHWVERLANIESINFASASIANAASARVAPQYEVRVIYEQQIDVPAERDRLTKELKKLETEMANAQRNLANEQFLAKAPAKVVEGIRKREAELTVLLEKSRSALAQLG
jgi:valyl-tRNA synthetase